MPRNDNNNALPDSCSRLTEIANQARERLIKLNVYQNQAGKMYGAEHPNARQINGGADDPLNIKGKGTDGGYLDTSNGGGYYDIYGKPEVQGSGRKNLLLKNKYSADNPYDCFIP